MRTKIYFDSIVSVQFVFLFTESRYLDIYAPVYIVRSSYFRHLGMHPSKVIAIVTGAASGLGKATATRFVKSGGRVVIADLPSSDGENVAKELGESAVFYPTNVRVFSCVS